MMETWRVRNPTFCAVSLFRHPFYSRITTVTRKKILATLPKVQVEGDDDDNDDVHFYST